jgi:hypothetical protein
MGGDSVKKIKREEPSTAKAKPQLRKQTLRKLSHDELKRVVGGDPTTTCSNTSPPHHHEED